MNHIYVVIETADIELLGVRAYTRRDKADSTFELCAAENNAPESDDVTREIKGTRRFAGPG